MLQLELLHDGKGAVDNEHCFRHFASHLGMDGLVRGGGVSHALTIVCAGFRAKDYSWPIFAVWSEIIVESNDTVCSSLQTSIVARGGILTPSVHRNCSGRHSGHPGTQPARISSGSAFFRVVSRCKPQAHMDRWAFLCVCVENLPAIFQKTGLRA